MVNYGLIPTADYKISQARRPAHFILRELNGRDCLITPDGHAFLSLGVNHVQAVAQKGSPDLFADKYDKDWGKLCASVHKNLKSLGFNTAGYGAPGPLRKMMPFMAESYLLKNSNFLGKSAFVFPDIFDPKVQQGIKGKIEQMVAKAKGNPNLIGYYWTDTPQWDLNRANLTRGTNWVTAIRELPESAPGKKRYQQYLADCKSNGVTADDDGFLRLIAREYYQLVGKETRRLDETALIFGERYLVNDHPACVLEEAMPFIDVLSIQPGGARFRPDYLDSLHAKFKKPIILCDHQSSFATDRYPSTMWQQLESEEAAGMAYAKYLEDALAKPYIVGYHRCQYIDRYQDWKGSGLLKQGLVREDGRNYETLARITAQANRLAIDDFQSPTARAKRRSNTKNSETVVLKGFENEESLKGHNTSHKANVTLVENAPKGGGKLLGEDGCKRFGKGDRVLWYRIRNSAYGSYSIRPNQLLDQDRHSQQF